MINSDLVRVKNLEQAVLELGQRVITLEQRKIKTVLKCPFCRGNYQRNNYRMHVRGVRWIKGRRVCPGMPQHPNFHARQVHIKKWGKAAWRTAAV